MNTKTCKQCGFTKPIEQFRKYYGGRKGNYNTCKTCERINSRVKYLSTKDQDDRTDEETEELEQLYVLWDTQRASGLQPPTQRVSGKTPSTKIQELIDSYGGAAIKRPTVDSPAIPRELQIWLTCELTDEPDYYLDEVYERLREAFRPVLHIDTSTMLPMYDETYKSVLDIVLDRFNSYEDSYYDKE